MKLSSYLKYLEKKSIIILGLGREGLSSYKFLRSQFPSLIITLADKQTLTALSPEIRRRIEKDQVNKLVQLNLGSDYLDHLQDFDLICKTPGMPATTPEVETVLAKNTHLISNTYLLFEVIKHIRQESPLSIDKQPQIIGVTGTKGKSTTASLIHHILKEAGLNAVLGGNIGLPPLDVLNQITEGQLPNLKIVLELSSHQLAELKHSPQVAIIQEITSEHLDYYTSTADYVNAKTSICRYQTRADTVIYNPSSPMTENIARLSPGKHIHFGLEKSPTNQVYLQENALLYQEQVVIETKDIPLVGEHNLQNVMPAVIVGSLFKITVQQINTAIRNFKSLPHRLELVKKTQGITYYNDSLATTPQATIAALNSFNQQPIVLIAGGYERHLNYDQLATTILKHQIKKLILLPPTGKRIWQAIEQQSPNKSPLTHFFVNSMEEAVQQAIKDTSSGDIVLLSPASASFGLFKDYQDRGNQFKKWVNSFTA